MTDRVQIRTRRSALAEKVQREVQETVVLRNEEVIAVLPEGDPLAYVLQLSTSELLAMRERLRPVLESRPEVRALLEALIHYRLQRGAKGDHRQLTDGCGGKRGREALS